MERILSKRFQTPDSHTIESYLKDGGYEAARKALTSMTPEAIIDEVKRSNLRGLGGAGFPTGMKWSFIPKDSPKPKYLVINADEGEPGTCKDRALIVKNPHALIEGMVITSFAIGAHKAYIYIRGEYVEPAGVLQRAIDEAYAQGFLGDRIFGRHTLDIVVHRGAGAYICGEETALLESLEGKKGFPRLKPPFPAVSGLFACPTVVNNVETLSCVPHIIARGAQWFAGLGTERSGGTRLFSVTGHVEKPGVYEAPHTVTLRQLIHDFAGGVRGGRKLKAVIPGGISAKILTAAEIDVQMDFDALIKAGTMAGSAGVMVMDDTTSMVKALYVASKFFAHESCGQCSPCREGTGWFFKIVSRIAAGKGRLEDLDVLLESSARMAGRTICVFADAASWPIESYITKFRPEFEEHIRSGRSVLGPGVGVESGLRAPVNV